MSASDPVCACGRLARRLDSADEGLQAITIKWVAIHLLGRQRPLQCRVASRTLNTLRRHPLPGTATTALLEESNQYLNPDLLIINTADGDVSRFLIVCVRLWVDIAKGLEKT